MIGNKKKILYEYRSRNRIREKYRRKKLNFSETDTIPLTEKMRAQFGYEGINFDPLKCFLLSKIGQNWNDVYSEILTKIENSKRWRIDLILDWLIQKPVSIDKNGIAYSKRFYWSGGVLLKQLYIDKFNVLRWYDTKEEMMSDYKKCIRQEKLKRILK
jgi:hypothetical protein